MPFRVNRGFVSGYNLVQIINAAVVEFKGYDVLSLTFRNEYGMESNFIIFLNDFHLLNQLLNITFDSFTYDEDIDEKNFIDLVLYAYLEPKDTYMKITKLKEYVEDEDAL